MYTVSETFLFVNGPFMKKFLSAIIPWLVAALVLWLLFKKVPPAEFFPVMSKTNWVCFGVLSVLYFLAIYFLDAIGIHALLNRFVTSVTVKEVLAIRGRTYLVMLINYMAAQGSIALDLKKNHDAPAGRTLGAMGLLTLLDFSMIMGCGLIATIVGNPVYSGFPLRYWMMGVTALFFISFFFVLLVLRKQNTPFFSKLKKISLVKKVLEASVFSVFHEAKRSDLVKLFLLRAPVIILTICLPYFVVTPFGGKLPWASILSYGPIILFISVLPITPGGLGSFQVLTVEFFKLSLICPLIPLFSSDHILLAASLLWAFTNWVLKALTGMAFFIGLYFTKSKLDKS